MKSAATWFYILTVACVITPYALGVRPRTQREWHCIALAVTFLAWILLLMEPLRAGS
jgi:hypothetical protein